MTILGRKNPLFKTDVADSEDQLSKSIAGSSFLVVGGAGSIGQQVTREIFARHPLRLHVVDISENNLVELVRDIRSSLGYIKGEFKTLPLDAGSVEFAAFLKDQKPYDFILNLSALKHVRSEKDPYTLMRMIRVNILNTESSLAYAIGSGTNKYFAVSSDKAVNPANAMGATKRVMELCLLRASTKVSVSMARFANVAFSDGSLLHGFRQRLAKRQPLSAPKDVLRYFMTAEEAGQLCLMSCLLGGNRDLFFPKASAELALTGFQGIAERFLESQGFRAEPCSTEEEARSKVDELRAKKKWPCYFFASDTEGEKEAEELFNADEAVDLDRFRDIGIIRNPLPQDLTQVGVFLESIRKLVEAGRWDKGELAELLLRTVPEFRHKASQRTLDDRM